MRASLLAILLSLLPVTSYAAPPSEIQCRVVKDGVEEKYCPSIKLRKKVKGLEKKLADLEEKGRVVEKRLDDVQLTKVITSTDSLELKGQVGYSWKEKAYLGFLAGFKYNQLGVSLAFNKERIKEKGEDEIDISGFRIVGDTTEEKNHIWFNISGTPNWLTYRNGNFGIEGALQLSAGAELLIKKLNPEDSDAKLTTEFKFNPFLGGGVRIDAIYQIGGTLPVLKDIKLGTSVVWQYWNMEFTGKEEGNANFLSGHLVLSYILD